MLVLAVAESRKVLTIRVLKEPCALQEAVRMGWWPQNFFGIIAMIANSS